MYVSLGKTYIFNNFLWFLFIKQLILIYDRLLSG